MPAYVPPHARNAQAPAASAGEDRWGSGDRTEDTRGGGRGVGDQGGGGNRRTAEGGRARDAPRDGGARRDLGRDSGDNGGRGARSTATANPFTDGAGGDWKHRQEGRRVENERTELEVFGEPKKEQNTGMAAGLDKYDNIPVQISGSAVEDLKPISRFSDANLTDSLFDNLKRCGYERPTPVQKHSIPIVVAGRDLMACAQTGSGKTCAFMVPCLEALLRSGPPRAQGGSRQRRSLPCGLVLAPTRELAAQIHVEAEKFSFHTGIRCCIIYGGADIREQRNDLEKGCDILVATPGRLTDMAERGYVSLELVQFFILDEADRMLDMGFEPQVRQIVEKLGMGRNSTFPRQSMMFSATFAREVQVMAQDFLNDYVFITVGRVGSASECVTQKVVYAGDVKQKCRELGKAIKEHVKEDGLAVVFVETKKAADNLELDLHDQGVKVACIHGDRSQAEREEALYAFKSGANPVLVATDVAARGLDIPNVMLVVNFDMPKHLDDYVHRIGRTGRAGRKGNAVAFVNERCGYLPDLYDLLSEAKQEVPIWLKELIQASARSGGKGSGGRGANFGGQDLRVANEAAKASPVGSVATPTRASGPAAAAPPSWGATGADDAW